MSYPYKYTYPENYKAIGYVGPMPIEVKIDLFRNGIVDSASGKALIRSALQRLLMTNMGERVMQPEFGSKIKAFLFEPLDDALLAEMKEILGERIEYHEPRIKLIDIDFKPDYDNHTVVVSISYFFKQSGEKDMFSFLLS